MFPSSISLRTVPAFIIVTFASPIALKESQTILHKAFSPVLLNCVWDSNDSEAFLYTVNGKGV